MLVMSYKEKMDLEVEVARLKMLKTEHQSAQYRLEDRHFKSLSRADLKRNKSLFRHWKRIWKQLYNILRLRKIQSH